MYTIVQSPNPILRTPAQNVAFSGPKLQKIIDEMIETMVAQNDPEGVGLAANQVDLPWKIFVARFSTKKNESIRVFVNPEIVEQSTEMQSDSNDKKSPLEGCLSRPNYYGPVKRWKWVKLRFQQFNPSNDRLELKEETFKDFAATVIQHEMDHLSGKLFIERILEQKGKLYVITGKDKNGKEKWEEVELI